MTKTADFVCPKCKREYFQKEFGLLGAIRCKDCKEWLDPISTGIEKTSESLQKPSTQTSGLGSVQTEKQSLPEVALVDLLLAQNRTTHAIRSLAVFFFISVLSTVIGYGIVGFGAGSRTNCSAYSSNCGDPGFVVFGWIVIVVGFFIALGVGVSELGKSRVD